jgi:hypothetical protein
MRAMHTTYCVHTWFTRDNAFVVRQLVDRVAMLLNAVHLQHLEVEFHALVHSLTPELNAQPLRVISAMCGKQQTSHVEPILGSCAPRILQYVCNTLRGIPWRFHFNTTPVVVYDTVINGKHRIRQQVHIAWSTLVCP